MSSFDYVGPPVLSTSNGQDSALLIGTVEVASSDNDLEVNFTYSTSSGSTFAYLAFHDESDTPVYQFGFGFDSAAVGTTGDIRSYVSSISHPTAGSYTIKLYILLPYYPGTAYVNELHVVAATVPPPPNDDFADAISLSGDGTSSATTRGATLESGEPYHWFQGEPGPGREGSVWYRWEPTAEDQIFYVLITSGDMSAYEGTSLDNLTRVSNSDTIEYPLDSDLFWQYAMINGELGKTYHIAIEGWADFDFRWITEASPAYRFDGPPTLLTTADFGPEGFAFQDKEDPPGVAENYGYSNALIYGTYVTYDDFPPLGDVFEGEHFIWRPTVIDRILYVPWRDLGAASHGTDVVDHDPAPKAQIWVYENGLLNPPTKDRFDDALNEVVNVHMGGFTNFGDWRQMNRVMYGDGHLFVCWESWLAKLTLEGDLVAVVESPDSAAGSTGGEFASSCLEVSDTEFISPSPNDFGGLTDPCLLWNMQTLDYEPIALDGGDFAWPILMPEDRILSLSGGGDGFTPITLRLWDNTWRSSADELETWTVYPPDPQWFDDGLFDIGCLARDGHTIYLSRFWEPYDGHKRTGNNAHDQNILGGNWITASIYAFDLNTSQLEEVGRYDYWPRWSNIFVDPNWYFPQWLLDADIMLRPELKIGDLTERARPMGGR